MINIKSSPGSVREALERTDIMALSTIDEDGGPWTSPVQFLSDSQLDLYFASMPDDRHVHDIERDAQVEVAIYSVPGPPGGNLGLQIRGVATEPEQGSGPPARNASRADRPCE